MLDEPVESVKEAIQQLNAQNIKGKQKNFVE